MNWLRTAAGYLRARLDERSTYMLFVASVGSERRRRLSAAKSVNDLEVGDMVVNIVTKKKGVVMYADPPEQDDRYATVDYFDGDSDRLPLAAFRRLSGCGHDWDARR